jgi:hypothetical protein
VAGDASVCSTGCTILAPHQTYSQGAIM